MRTTYSELMAHRSRETRLLLERLAERWDGGALAWRDIDVAREPLPGLRDEAPRLVMALLVLEASRPEWSSREGIRAAIAAVGDEAAAPASAAPPRRAGGSGP